VSVIPSEISKLLIEYFSKVYEMVEGFMNAISSLNMVDVQNAYKHLEDSIKLDTEADELRRAILEKLSSDSVDPAVRSDIARLLRMMDKVSEWVKEALRYLDLVPYLEIPQEIKDSIEGLAKLNLDAVKTVREAVEELVQGRLDEVYKHCIAVERIEEEADEIMHRGRRGLLKYGPRIGNPALVIMLRDFLKALENAIDYSEDVADTLRVLVARAGSRT